MPAKTLENPSDIQDQLHALQEQQNAAAASHQDEVARLEALKEQAVRLRVPLGQLASRKSTINELLARARRHRAQEVEAFNEFRRIMDSAIGNENEGAPSASITLLMLQDNRRHLLVAGQAITEIDRWTEDRDAELARIEVEAREYAEANDLQAYAAELGFNVE